MKTFLQWILGNHIKKSDAHLAKGQYILHFNCTIFMPDENVIHSLREALKIQQP